MMNPTKQDFSLGDPVATRGVDNLMNQNPSFRNFVQISIRRYFNCDWGDLCDDDWKQNDEAVRNGERIFASYYHDASKTKIWIITEWNRSVTTILFPEEY